MFPSAESGCVAWFHDTIQVESVCEDEREAQLSGRFKGMYWIKQAIWWTFDGKPAAIPCGTDREERKTHRNKSLKKEKKTNKQKKKQDKQRTWLWLTTTNKLGLWGMMLAQRHQTVQTGTRIYDTGHSSSVSHLSCLVRIRNISHLCDL